MAEKIKTISWAILKISAIMVVAVSFFIPGSVGASEEPDVLLPPWFVGEVKQETRQLCRAYVTASLDDVRKNSFLELSQHALKVFERDQYLLSIPDGPVAVKAGLSVVRGVDGEAEFQRFAVTLNSAVDRLGIELDIDKTIDGDGSVWVYLAQTRIVPEDLLIRAIERKQDSLVGANVVKDFLKEVKEQEGIVHGLIGRSEPSVYGRIIAVSLISVNDLPEAIQPAWGVYRGLIYGIYNFIDRKILNSIVFAFLNDDEEILTCMRDFRDDLRKVMVGTGPAITRARFHARVRSHTFSTR